MQHAGLYFIGHKVPLLNSAAATAWRIDAPAAWVTVERAGAVFTVKNDPRIAGLLKPCPARYSVEFNVIAGVYPGAALGAATRIFGAHTFNGHLVPLYQKM